MTTEDEAHTIVLEGPYEIKPEMKDRIINDFTYHPVNAEQATRMAAIRQQAGDLAGLILISTPPSREQALALTNLEQVSMWANASIARHESGI